LTLSATTKPLQNTTDKAGGGGGASSKAPAALPGISSNGPSILSITAGIDKTIAGALSGQGTPNGSLLIRRQNSSRRMG
jgi:hypothetical protein